MKTLINNAFTIINYLVIFSFALGIATGCGSGEEAVDHDHAGETGQTTKNVVTISKEQADEAGIVLGSMERTEVFEKVRANGYFHTPPQNKAQVSAFYPGYVKKTSLLVGDVVKKGQVIAILQNPEYIKLQQRFMEVKGQLEYLKSEYDRKKILAGENIASKKNLMKAEADYNTTLAQYKGLKGELVMMGFDIDNIIAGNYTSSMAVRAPIAGSVTQVNMVIGKYIQPQEVLMEIIDTDHLHVELNVFEKDVLKVKEGQAMQLRLPSINNKIYKGEIHLVGKAFEGDQRTVNVHGHLKDELIEFIPGIYVEADILVKSTTVDALPQAALVSQEGKEYIFTRIGESQGNMEFQRLEVTTGIKGDGWVEIKINEQGDWKGRIVVEGVYFLSSGFEEKAGHSH
ncbi:efflux RND transporter periplasmic adaptor subunit [Fulvivirgaceae bacterium BMA12]|uniref:Efflux RND transporter periplasmic adaptor subunit n=1 Tax=Agaribacillus aureus TaxID=3051825 RepID=A0ABT8LGV0_9BACT|nr:efflux RND transporter periplasmic adaptor subunit [Fulvivirgaceae bacterium BMA12]